MMKARLIIQTFVIATLLYSRVLGAAVPGQVNFQGVLLDNTNQLINGSADFDFAIFDAASGGTLLWSESQASVPVNNGTYSVALGSVNPVTVTILSSGTVYLEVTVDSDTLSPRQRLLAVPYALEAASVNGVSGVFVQQIFQHVDYDGQSQPNDDPEQGFDDIDGDGLANFIDPDNDGDGFLDDTELANGTGVNLVTPIITSVQNAVTPYVSGHVGQNETFNVIGTGFLPGITVQVGPETPIAQNMTSTSFDISVGAGQVSGGAVVIDITNPNAETTGTASIIFYDKIVFLTEDRLIGALGATTATADAFCASTALTAGLSGTFMAWFSDVDAGIGPLDRFTDGVWGRVDGAIVAIDLSDLTDGSIGAPINIFEDGSVQAGATPRPATNTLSNGLPDPLACSAANPTLGLAGASQTTSSLWTQHSKTFNCTTASLRYYCFEQ